MSEGRIKWPSCCVPGRAASGGFSFIEVLVSLFMVAILAVVMGGAVIIALRAEEQGGAVREAGLRISNLQVADSLPEEAVDVEDAGRSRWRISSEEEVQGDYPTQTVWRVKSVTHTKTDFRTTIAFKQAVPVLE